MADEQHDRILELARRDLLRSGAFLGTATGVGVGASGSGAAAGQSGTESVARSSGGSENVVTVEDFEHGQLDPDEYDHDTDWSESRTWAAFDVTEGSLTGDGTYLLEATQRTYWGGNPQIYTREGVLNYTPERNDIITFHTAYNHDNHSPRFHFGVQDEDNHYTVRYDSRHRHNPTYPDTLSLIRSSSSGRELLAQADAPFSEHANEPLTCVIEWGDPITVTFFDSDGEVIASVSASDDTFTDGGIGFGIRGYIYRSDRVTWDQVTAVPGGAGAASTVVVDQDGMEPVTVTPLRSAGEDVVEFYSDDGATPAAPETGLESPGTSLLVPYEDPDGALSLVVIHDDPDDGDGGRATFDFQGLPEDGEWIRRDNGEVEPDANGVTWSWDSGESAGGVLQGGLDPDGAFSVRIEPEFVEGIEEWEFLGGDADDPERINLEMDESATIRIKGFIDEARFDYEPIAPDEGEEITFDASATEGAAAEYTWEFGDGTTNTGEVVTHAYEEPGQYDVTLTVQGAGGSAETTETVGVGSLEVEQTRERTTVNSPVTAQVMEPTGDGYEYHWRVLDKPEGSEPGLLHGENYPEEDQPPNSEAKPHAALRPDVAGEDPYVLEVEAFDDDGDYLGIEVVEIEVEERGLDEIVGFDVDGAETVSELVELYAPNYHFHSREKYIPTRYEAYAENASVLELLIEDDTDRTLWELLLDGAGSVGDLLDIWGSDTVLAWLDATFGYDFLAGTPSLLELGEIADEEPDGPLALHLHGDETDYREYQVQYPPTIHANVHVTEPEEGPFADKKYLAITYWAFYLFDPKKEGDWTDFDDSAKAFATSHASDTETVTILIDQNGPQWVAAAQHYSGEYMQWEKVSGTDGPRSIDIYPSWGAHSSFLVNTKKYDSKIPGQVRWIGPEKDSTFPLGGLASDVTASYWEWSHDDSQYDLVVLTGDEPWGDFEGEFTSDNGLPKAEGGVLPQVREQRFNSAGEWIPDRMLPEPDVLDPDHPELEIPKIFARFTIDSVVGSPSSFKIEPFENPGVKPHTFVTEATVTATATGETWIKKERTELGWTGMTPIGATTIEISLDDLDLPNEGDLVVEAEILTYPSDITTEADVLYETTEDTSLSLLPFDLEVPDFMTAESDQETIAPGDVIERSVEIESKGSEPDSVLVTLMAVDPYGRFHIDEFDGYETITVDPDESREMTLSWTADEEIPEGEYNLRIQVWAESDLAERVTELAEYTEQNAFTVKKPDGTLSVSTTPPDAVVVVNGELLNEQSIEHPVGTYKVTAIHGDFGTETKSVRIEEGKTTRVEIDVVGDKPWIGDYTNARWIVTRGGLKRAERDWSRGEINEGLYRAVKRAYKHGEPLYEHRTPADHRSEGNGRPKN